MRDWFLTSDATPELRLHGLLLRAARASDYDAWQKLRRQSHAFLKPFEPRWGESDLTKFVFKSRLKRSRQEANSGSEFCFLIFKCDQDQEELVGGLTLSNIRRRASQSATLGYWMGVDCTGQGIMSNAVAAIIPYVFNNLCLHRLQAASLPHNKPSRAVLEKNGFNEEGYAENYLQIDGMWQDHVLYALTRERYEGRRD